MKVAPYGQFSIYALKDPITHRVFYIGRSKHPSTRILQHIAEAQGYKAAKTINAAQLLGLEPFSKLAANNIKKLKWINNILDKGLQPDLCIMDEWECLDVADANRLEDAWIAEMRKQGEPLTNRILSHRMRPDWYRTSPTQYIEWLKSGKPKSKIPQPNDTPTIYKKKVYRRRTGRRKSKSSGWGRSTQFTRGK